MKTKPFDGAKFTPTEWDDAAQKTKFANHFARFVESGFQPTLFPDWFYKRLSSCFGHIAHFDRGGFYATWFDERREQLHFLRNALRWPCHGDPGFTYSDVEREIKGWLAESGLVEKLKAELAAEVEAGERAKLAWLKAKYEPEAKAAA